MNNAVAAIFFFPQSRQLAIADLHEIKQPRPVFAESRRE